MPDGSGKIDDAKARVDNERAQGWAWLPRTRNTWLLICAGVLAAGFAALGAFELWGAGGLVTAETAGYVVAASAVLALLLLLLLLDPVENLASPPRLRLPVVTSLVLCCLAAVAVADHYLPTLALLKSPEAKLAYFAFLGAAFIPRIWNAGNVAHHKERSRVAAEDAVAVQVQRDLVANRAVDGDLERRLAEHQESEPIAALISTLVVAAIILVAYFVGGLRGEPELGASLGVTIFVSVVSLFAAIVFLDWIADLSIVRGANRALRAGAPLGRLCAAFYDWIDRGFVFIGGHVAGADHDKPASRYGVLVATLLCLAVMGWFLPAPWGLPVVAIGLVVALSLSRLWSWVEEDRSLASITQFSPRAPRKIGFREDFRDETLLGFIFVLALVPIGMMQAHSGNALGKPLFEGVDGAAFDDRSFWTWLGYFGFELAKALPIVDWADIYKLGPGGDSITPTKPLGMHAVFAARAMVDLILIAALLQAISIAQRNRQQKSLYAARQIDRLDELVEKAELKKAIAATLQRDANRTFTLGRLGETSLIDFRVYNETRMRELHAKNPDNADLRAFVEAIFEQRGLTLAPAIVELQNIASTHRNEMDLISVYNQAKKDHLAGVHRIEVDDIEATLFELRKNSGMREFKFELVEMAQRIGTPERLLDLLTTVAVGEKEERDAYLYMRQRCADVTLKQAPNISASNAIVDALRMWKQNGADSFGERARTPSVVIEALTRRLDELSRGSA